MLGCVCKHCGSGGMRGEHTGCLAPEGFLEIFTISGSHLTSKLKASGGWQCGRPPAAWGRGGGRGAGAQMVAGQEGSFSCRAEACGF